jgi:hypothetical protein
MMQKIEKNVGTGRSPAVHSVLAMLRAPQPRDTYTVSPLEKTFHAPGKPWKNISPVLYEPWIISVTIIGAY